MFKIESAFKPTGDQPEAIDELEKGIKNGIEHQTLLGVTGSGKTFTIANVIERVQKPTLILSHNKTLAAQLYAEFKAFFPNNAVQYFVSYYDYYQPEAYLPVSSTYIEKDLSINDEIEMMRLATTSALLSGRKDVIVVASVSCLYGMGNPKEFSSHIVHIKKGQVIRRDSLLLKFVDALYSRTQGDFLRGNFRVKGDTIDIFPAYTEEFYRIHFWGNEIEEIESIDPFENTIINTFEELDIYPKNLFATSKETLNNAIKNIQSDLVEQITLLRETGKHIEAKRLKERTEFDIEMIKELGYCSGIENYSRYLDGRQAGERPSCLLDYFKDNYLMIVDESHATISQIKAMHGGDYSRKKTLVEYGFRLSAAIDNRPLKFEEFETINKQVIYISATPADYELDRSNGVFVEQIIRPTGLLDPNIEVRPIKNQIDNLIEEIQKRNEANERTLITTLTKRMAEELSKYLGRLNIRCRYIHSDIDTLERIEIMQDLRMGIFDVLIGINLLREGLDLPEVSLVAILDADKEGFLRSHTALTQTAGRAARNVNGTVIMYADKITKSMQKTIDETTRRRTKQMEYNKTNNMTPTPLKKEIKNDLIGRDKELIKKDSIRDKTKAKKAFKNKSQVAKEITKAQTRMEQAAEKLDFIEAAYWRDIIKELKDKNEI